MRKFIRNMSKTKAGNYAIALFLVMILATFAAGDVANVRSGAFGLGSTALADVGGAQVTDQDMADAMELQLNQLRQTKQDADYADLAGNFDPTLALLIRQRALSAFAKDNNFTISEALVNAAIADIPGTRDLAGQFTQQSYLEFLAQARLSDAQVKSSIEAELNSNLLLLPSLSELRVPTLIADPYVRMLLERRVGVIGLVPADRLEAGIAPTDAELTQFYNAQKERYTVPEQRVLRYARIGMDRVADVAATDAEVDEAFARQNQDFSAKEVRVISQAVLPDKAAADALATRARNGSFAAAAAPAGFSAADISVGPQNKQQFENLAGKKVADAAFAASVKAGTVVGPIQSDLGWHVVRIDDVRTDAGGDSAKARADLATAITQQKRQDALLNLITEIEDAIADGSSFAEVAQRYELTEEKTPVITASGRSRSNPDFRPSAELVPVIQAGFALMADDDAVVESMGEGNGYALVDTDRILPQAPAPLAEIKEQVRGDFIQDKANGRAAAIANQILARVKKGEAMRAAFNAVAAAEDVSLPSPEEAPIRRLELAQMGGQVPPALDMLFRLKKGEARLAGDPGSRGVYIVLAKDVIAGDPLSNPGLSPEWAGRLQRPMTQELGEQFLAAVVKDVGVTRNPDNVEKSRARIFGTGN